MINKIKEEFKKNIDKKYQIGATNFFKEEVKIIGVRLPRVRKIANKYFKEIKDLDKKEIFKICEDLLKTNYNEDATLAFSWCYKIKNKYDKNDFILFESWVKSYLTNWAMVDDFCTHTVGHLVYQNKEFIKNLKEWTKSNNRWVRRASAVSLIHPVRRKKYLKEVFEISDLLLLDKDDMVQKGYGWMLKVASDVYQKEVFNYVMKNKHKMPRTSLRYAIEKMPKELKIKAMEK